MALLGWTMLRSTDTRQPVAPQSGRVGPSVAVPSPSGGRVKTATSFGNISMCSFATRWRVRRCDGKPREARTVHRLRHNRRACRSPSCRSLRWWCSVKPTEPMTAFRGDDWTDWARSDGQASRASCNRMGRCWNRVRGQVCRVTCEIMRRLTLSVCQEGACFVSIFSLLFTQSLGVNVT